MLVELPVPLPAISGHTILKTYELMSVRHVTLTFNLKQTFPRLKNSLGLLWTSNTLETLGYWSTREAHCTCPKAPSISGVSSNSAIRAHSFGIQTWICVPLGSTLVHFLKRSLWCYASTGSCVPARWLAAWGNGSAVRQATRIDVTCTLTRWGGCCESMLLWIIWALWWNIRSSRRSIVGVCSSFQSGPIVDWWSHVLQRLTGEKNLLWSVLYAKFCSLASER